MVPVVGAGGRQAADMSRRHRSSLQLALDCLAWAVGLTCALSLRYDLAIGVGHMGDLAVVLPVAFAAQLLTGLHAGLYRGRWRYGSFDEVAALTQAAALATLLTWVASRWPMAVLPRSVVPAGGITALVSMAGIRYVWRLILERQRRPDGERCRRMLVIGAGEGGVQIVTALLRDPSSPYLPVALLDDDPEKRNLRIMGVRVLGSRQDLVAVARATSADTVLVAIPSADARLIREVTEQAVATGLEVKVLPRTRDLLAGTVRVGDIRTPTEADLMGRRQVDTDLGAIADYLTGRCVLVTGAGGSIGSELCRQLVAFRPAELVLLDRDESALHAVQLSLEGRALLDRPNLVVADIRDRARVSEIFTMWRPDVVFHAAALKHLPLLELHPGEAVKTNVLGTRHVLEAAQAAGVERFVNISTDKAADPASVLGHTKRLAERLTAHTADTTSRAFISVRFGNVLGSRGSMLGTFQAQIAAGGPVTVTHPEVTRYFMTIEEAVQLVVQAGAIGRGGEVLVLEMGEPVRIREVAQRMIAHHGADVEIVYTGLRPGEKLHEVLWGEGEVDHRPAHPLISHVRVPPLDPAAAELECEVPGAELVHQLERATRGAATMSGTPV
jgi:FlaA1/EpsC-like NDP-sugar epimerase